MKKHVFVYGTLRKGQKYYSEIIEKVISVQKATISGIMYHLSYGYLILGEGLVKGEILEFDDLAGALRIMDRIEGYNGPGSGSPKFPQVINIGI